MAIKCKGIIMISFSNAKDPIQSFLSYSPVRFFLHRIDYGNNPDNYYVFRPKIVIFVEYNEMVVEKLKELGFTIHTENLTPEDHPHIATMKTFTCVYEILLVDDLEKRRQFSDIFSDLGFLSAVDENQFFEYVKSIDDGSELFYKDLRDKLRNVTDALSLMTIEEKES